MFTNLKILILIVTVTSLGTSVFGYIKEKPDWIKTCSKKDSAFKKCSTTAVQGLFDKMADGIPEVNLSPTEPLKLASIKITQSGEGPISLNCSLKNVTVTGFGKSHVVSNWVDPKNYDWTTKVHMDHMRISGKYSLLGRILLLPLRGLGDCWFDVSDINIVAYSDVDLYQKDGFSFYNITAVHIKFQFNGLKLYLGNLFNGVKALEESTNAYLNSNWKPMAEAMNPVLTDTVEEIMYVILKKIFDKTPADFWVKDIAEPIDLSKQIYLDTD